MSSIGEGEEFSVYAQVHYIRCNTHTIAFGRLQLLATFLALGKSPIRMYVTVWDMMEFLLDALSGVTSLRYYDNGAQYTSHKASILVETWYFQRWLTIALEESGWKSTLYRRRNEGFAGKCTHEADSFSGGSVTVHAKEQRWCVAMANQITDLSTMRLFKFACTSKMCTTRYITCTSSFKLFRKNGLTFTRRYLYHRCLYWKNDVKL